MVKGFALTEAKCHSGKKTAARSHLKKVILAGSPNVGKSLIFNRLSGAYVTVSNYPGTTVEVSRAVARIDGTEYELLDTPGMYSLMPVTDEERVTRDILLSVSPAAAVQVVDARDFERALPLTFQLIEAGLPLILDLNMMDDVQKMGLKLDLKRLEADLGIPVVSTIATNGSGVEELKKKLARFLNQHG